MSEVRLESKSIALLGTLVVGLFIGGMFGLSFAPQAAEEQSGLVEINVTASQWEWNPNPIIVTEGDLVRLRISSTFSKESQFSIHSIIIEHYQEQQVELPAGQITVVEFLADRAGEFNINCGIFCGGDHAGMVGKLIVQVKGAGDILEDEPIEPFTRFEEGITVEDLSSYDPLEFIFVVQRENASVAVIDGISHTILAKIYDIGFQPHTMAFSSDVQFAYIISREGWLTKISLTTLEVEGQVRVGESSRASAISTDNKYVAVGNYDPFDFVIVNASNMNIIKRYQAPIYYNSTGHPLDSRVAAILETNNNYMIVAFKEAGEVWAIDMNQTHFPIAKIFHNVGEILHDAFFTEDGRYYMLASQGSDKIWVLDVYNLTEIGFIDTGEKPHPGPGAVWHDLAFSPSIGSGNLTIWNTTSWEFVRALEIGGPGLFIRTSPLNDTYPYIWWDTILDSNVTKNAEIHILDARTVNDPTPSVTTIAPCANSLHPEFTYSNDYVYISCWQEEGKIMVFDAYNFNLVTEITGLITPTGKFNVGNRLQEPGI
jgi:nitrite reductase (NO-forming)/hydroxylamine reductase